ncbi:class I adenylate-forming enzyme family protein [Paenalcaligenes sp. Me131]|uniref:class I adenylate-forming enzyme family protein n=1 Tax=Paenalcaligenes sp. Me131 TaxID=3392636 RepID=UPI003D293C48
MSTEQFPQSSNLGGAIAEQVSPQQAWLIEVDERGQERVFSYHDLHDQAARIAGFLQQQGLDKGSRIGLMGLNSAEYLLAYYGIMQAGYCAVPIGFKLASDTIHYIVSDAQVQTVFCDSEFEHLLPKGTPHINLATLLNTVSGASNTTEIVVPQPSDAATILYTSGSTGVPKGVPLTHGGYVWALQKMRVNGGEFFQTHQANVLCAAPLSHMNALFLSKLVTAYGGTLVLLTKFTAHSFLQACQDHRCQVVTAVPTMLAMALRALEADPATYDFSAVLSVAMGSSPITEELHRSVSALFPNATVNNNWGTTETGPAVFGPHPAGLTRPALSLGHPIADVEVRLGPDNAEEGELWVRSRAVMPGYLNRDDETAKALHDGWYKTGDVMRRDADGFFYFVGRVDDMFVCGGENIYPSDVEKLLMKHPDVVQVAVVAVADPIKGQVPAAFVVKRQASHINEDDIKQFALQNGPVYQYPRHVRFIDDMPLLANNKLDKLSIKKMAAGYAK